MIKHIVFWKFAEQVGGKSRQENMAYVRERLLALRGIIPQIRSMEIGPDVVKSAMSYDMALVIDFDSLDDLETYKNHPDHKAVSKFVAGVRTDRAVVDFEWAPER